MRTRVLVAVAAILLLGLPACSDDDPGSAGATSPTGTTTETTGPTASEETPEPTETEEPTETDSPESSRQTELETEDSAFGTILTDSDGRTLYVFLNDPEGESTCTGGCADTWPPLIARGELEAGGDVDESLLDTIDGQHVTYAGRPLYYYAPDEQPGDTNGQGVGGVWFVVSPTGEPIEG